MRKLLILISIAVSLFGIAGVSLGEEAIDRLVEQARITEGDIAVRDLPRWRGAKKILIRDIELDVADLAATSPDVEFIVVASVEEARQYASEVDAIIGFCDSDLVKASDRLVWIQHLSSGVERCLPVEQIGNGDVVLTNMQKMSSPVIAEHAIAMMLSLARELPQFVNFMKDGDWAAGRRSTNGMMPVAGKTLLVAGLGGIGTEVARLGAALGMHVTGTRNSSRNGPDFVEYVGLSHELHEMAKSADVVVNALPLTDATRGLFDAEFFAAIKQGAIFVNVGRGRTVVTDALIAALESGAVSGAGLDVTDPEPLPADNPLWQRDDVIITPHVSSRGEGGDRDAVLLLENLKRYIAGDRLLNVVDPEKGY